MEAKIIGRGLLAGASAGVLAYVYARVLAEPIIGHAVDYEDGRGEAAAALSGTHDHETELFTRDVQAWAGLGFGVLAFSLAMGALFAVGFIIAHNRFPGVSARLLSLLLATGAFISVYLVPFLKYPANPPSIGQPGTITERTGLYLLMMLLSVALAIGAVWLGCRLAPRFGAWGATLIGLGAYLGAIAVVMLVLSPVDETPQVLTDKSGMIAYPGFPADDLYHFRLYALGAQVIIWATIGLVFGTSMSRLLDSRRQAGVSG